MRCPHCGEYNTRIVNRDWNNKHDHGIGSNCCRETWKCERGHTWTQWTHEG